MNPRVVADESPSKKKIAIEVENIIGSGKCCVI